MFTRNFNRVACLRSAFLFATIAGLSANSSILAQQQGKAKTAAKPISVNSLSMEVSALQALNYLQLDKGQLEKFSAWSETAVKKDQSRTDAKASKEYRDKLVELRRALQDGTDGDQISKLSSDLNTIQEKEKPTLDDRVEISDGARNRVVEAYRSLKPAQIAAYLGHVAEAVQDPVDRLIDALDEARTMKDEEWKGQRKELAEDITLIVAGPVAGKSNQMTEQIAAFLDRGRGIAEAELEKQAPGLEAEARKIVGNVAAEVILKNQVELDLATLLSNPRTPQACRALIRSANAASKQAGAK